MSSAVNLSSFPSDFSLLHYQNCTIAGEWAATYWRTAEIPLYWTMKFLQDGLSDYYSARNESIPNDYEIIAWILSQDEVGEKQIWDHMDTFAYDQCSHEVCPRIGWKGNSDLAGRGVRCPSLAGTSR